MIRTRLLLAIAAAAGVIATALPVTAMVNAPSPIGTWIDHKGRGAVEVFQCENGEGLCGKIVWLKDAADQAACGAPIMHQVKDQGDGTYDKGYLYDIEKNGLYHLALTAKADDTLEVHAYIMENWYLGRTMVFKKAPADLVRCTQTRTFDVTQLPEGVEIK